MDYDDEYEEPRYRRRRRALGHSVLGMVSLGIAVVVGIGEMILLAIAGIMESRTPEGIDEDSKEAMILGVLLIGGVIVSLVGSILAVAGLVQEGRSKVLPVLGLGFNGMIILGVIAIIIIGALSD